MALNYNHANKEKVRDISSDQKIVNYLRIS